MTARLRRRVAAAVAISIVATTLTACDPPPGDGAIALVVGGRNNMPRPQLTKMATDRLRAAFDKRDTMVVVDVTGDPKVRYTGQIDQACDSATTCDAAFRSFVAKVNRLLGGVKAEVGEADTLEAVLTAARVLRTYKGDKSMVVIDNGLQTVGAMPLQAPGALTAEPEAVVAPLAEKGRLDDLARLPILWTGLGSSAGRQARVPSDAAVMLEALWEGVLGHAEAQVEFDPTDLRDLPPADGLPSVTPVPFEPEKAPRSGGCFRLREDQIGFLGQKAEFRDPAKARQVLEPVAAELKRLNIPATVIGTTALPDGDDHGLSTRRAEKAVSVLVELGVPKRRLTPIGVGTEFADFVPDTDRNGNLIETLAVQNRLVIIQPAGQRCG
ncbi:OmpA family protein [Micromonospora tulbaghiae]|uniref:OmpA family protein n=1 Tax=Micromonospora TaxID=1873 RepID=UPI000EF59E5C|nr:OmpA family protein [Micromonospora sp. BL1]RLQ01390.1 hypothetical protein EAD96_23900 [Micromonospora sp. BL1]